MAYIIRAKTGKVEKKKESMGEFKARQRAKVSARRAASKFKQQATKSKARGLTQASKAYAAEAKRLEAQATALQKTTVSDMQIAQLKREGKIDKQGRIIKKPEMKLQKKTVYGEAPKRGPLIQKEPDLKITQTKIKPLTFGPTIKKDSSKVSETKLPEKYDIGGMTIVPTTVAPGRKPGPQETISEEPGMFVPTSQIILGDLLKPGDAPDVGPRPQETISKEPGRFVPTSQIEVPTKATIPTGMEMVQAAGEEQAKDFGTVGPITELLSKVTGKEITTAKATKLLGAYKAKKAREAGTTITTEKKVEDIVFGQLEEKKLAAEEKGKAKFAFDVGSTLVGVPAVYGGLKVASKLPVAGKVAQYLLSPAGQKLGMGAYIGLETYETGKAASELEKAQTPEEVTAAMERLSGVAGRGLGFAPGVKLTQRLTNVNFKEMPSRLRNIIKTKKPTITETGTEKWIMEKDGLAIERVKKVDRYGNVYDTYDVEPLYTVGQRTLTGKLTKPKIPSKLIEPGQQIVPGVEFTGTKVSGLRPVYDEVGLVGFKEIGLTRQTGLKDFGYKTDKFRIIDKYSGKTYDTFREDIKLIDGVPHVTVDGRLRVMQDFIVPSTYRDPTWQMKAGKYIETVKPTKSEWQQKLDNFLDVSRKDITGIVKRYKTITENGIKMVGAEEISVKPVEPTKTSEPVIETKTTEPTKTTETVIEEKLPTEYEPLKFEDLPIVEVTPKYKPIEVSKPKGKGTKSKRSKIKIREEVVPEKSKSIFKKDIKYKIKTTPKESQLDVLRPKVDTRIKLKQKLEEIQQGKFKDKIIMTEKIGQIQETTSGSAPVATPTNVVRALGFGRSSRGEEIGKPTIPMLPGMGLGRGQRQYGAQPRNIEWTVVNPIYEPSKMFAKDEINVGEYLKGKQKTPKKEPIIQFQQLGQQSTNQNSALNKIKNMLK